MRPCFKLCWVSSIGDYMSTETLYQLVVILVPLGIAIIGAVKLIIDQNTKTIQVKHAETIKAIETENAKALQAFELKANEQTAEAARLALIAATAAEQVKLQGVQAKAQLDLLGKLVDSIGEMNTYAREAGKENALVLTNSAEKLAANTESIKDNTAALAVQNTNLNTNQQQVNALSQAVASDARSTHAALGEIEKLLKGAIDVMGKLPTEVISAFGTEFQGMRTTIETLCSDFSRMTLKQNGGAVKVESVVDTAAPEQPIKITGVIEGIVETKGETK